MRPIPLMKNLRDDDDIYVPLKSIEFRVGSRQKVRLDEGTSEAFTIAEELVANIVDVDDVDAV